MPYEGLERRKENLQIAERIAVIETTMIHDAEDRRIYRKSQSEQTKYMVQLLEKYDDRLDKMNERCIAEIAERNSIVKFIEELKQGRVLKTERRFKLLTTALTCLNAIFLAVMGWMIKNIHRN